MSTTIGKFILLSGLSLVFLPAALSVQSAAGVKIKGQAKKQSFKPTIESTVKLSGDQFQLTFSTVPYTADPNSDYVRNYCARDKKHLKTN